MVYEYKGQKVETPFAPLASLMMFCQGFTETDRIVFFVTEEAQAANKDSLLSEIERLGLSAPTFKLIQTENTEEAIWHNFTTIFDYLNHGDQLYFDITYGFRAVPMLMMVLIHYAKFLKQIQVQKVVYGAWVPGNTITPIWDLTNFATLQDWTSGASNFVTSGNSKELSKILKQSQSLNLSALADALVRFTETFHTCRGRDIFDSLKLSPLLKSTEIVKEEKLPDAFLPIFQEIEKELQQFDVNENISNGLQAVKWCIKNNLTQQGITLLQETIKAFIAKENGLDAGIWEHSEIIASSFYHERKPYDQVLPKLKRYETDIRRISQTQSVVSLSAAYEQLRLLRNDINHAGLDNRAKEGAEFQLILERIFIEIENKLGLKL